MADYTHEFDVGGFLAANKLSYVDTIDSASGVYKVKDEAGKEFEFSAPGAIQSQGGNPATTRIANVNTPATASAQSPVSLGDREAIAFTGNDKGAVKYLKNKFDNVTLDKDKGVVVQQNGVWHQVDPSFLDQANPWEATKELAKDVITKGTGLAVDTAAMAAGATLGAAAGPWGAAGGAAVATSAEKAIRTTLGRAWGTYDATPQEEILDNGIESMLALLGQRFLPGTKPTAANIAEAIGKAPETVGEAARDGTAQIFNMLSGVSKRSASIALKGEAPLARDVATYDFNVLSQQSTGAARAALESMEKTLPRLYSEASADLIKTSEKKLGTVHVGDVVGQSLDALVDQGSLLKEATKTGKFNYRLPTDSEIVALRQSGVSAQTLSGEARTQLNPIIEQMNMWAKKYGEASGSKAAFQLMGLRKDLNEAVRVRDSESLTKTTKQLLYNMSGAFRTLVGQTFEKAGLAEEYASTSQVMQRYGDAANMATKLLNQDADGGITTFMNQIMKPMKNSPYFNSMENQMREIIGEGGNKLLDTAINKYAAADFSGIVPKGALQKVVATATAAGPLAMASKASSLAMMSARTQLYAARAAQLPGMGMKAIMESPVAKMAVDQAWKAKDFVLGLAPDQLKQMANDPQLMSALIQSVGMNTQAYHQASGALVQKVTGK